MDPSNPCDTQNFEKAFLEMKPVISDEIGEDKVQEQEQTDIDSAASEDLTSILSPRASHLPEGAVGDWERYTLDDQHSFFTDSVEGIHTVEEEDEESGSETPAITPANPEGNPVKQTTLETRLAALWISSPLTQRALESSEREPHQSTAILNSLPLPMLPCL
jgi:hypothetical protein